MTLNVDGIYTVVDPLLGGTNIATLIVDALLTRIVHGAAE